MPSIQPAIGSGIGITDYRGSCSINAQMRKDSNTMNDGEFRLYLQANAREAKQKQLSYIPNAPYWDIGGCVQTMNPPTGPSPY